jgi:hypothetical protein
MDLFLKSSLKLQRLWFLTASVLLIFVMVKIMHWKHEALILIGGLILVISYSIFVTIRSKDFTLSGIFRVIYTISLSGFVSFKLLHYPHKTFFLVSLIISLVVLIFTGDIRPRNWFSKQKENLDEDKWAEDKTNSNDSIGISFWDYFLFIPGVLILMYAYHQKIVHEPSTWSFRISYFLLGSGFLWLIFRIFKAK